MYLEDKKGLPIVAYTIKYTTNSYSFSDLYEEYGITVLKFKHSKEGFDLLVYMIRNKAWDLVDFLLKRVPDNTFKKQLQVKEAY